MDKLIVFKLYNLSSIYSNKTNDAQFIINSLILWNINSLYCLLDKGIENVGVMSINFKKITYKSNEYLKNKNYYQSLYFDIQVVMENCENELEFSFKNANIFEKYTIPINIIEYNTLAKAKEYPHMVRF